MTRAPLHGGYLVPAKPLAVDRPNRTAAGMSKTLERKKRRRQRLGPSKLSDDALALVVRGTTDKLGAAHVFRFTRKTCECCGSKTGKLMLNDRGRERLARMRRRKLKEIAA
jgi:hypothetical protein